MRTQLQRNKEEAIRNNKHPKDQLLRAGYAVCAYCGRNMIVRSSGRYMRYMCSAKNGDAYNTCPGGGPSVTASLLDEDIWSKVLVVLSSDLLVRALLNRIVENALHGEVSTKSLRERLEGFDGVLDGLSKRRKNLRRMQETANDEGEFEEIEGRIKEVTRQQQKTQANRDEVEAQLAAIAAARSDKILIVDVESMDELPAPLKNKLIPLDEEQTVSDDAQIPGATRHFCATCSN